jgi:hypothetical protein
MDGAKTWYRYFRHTHLSVVVNRRTFCAEAFPRGRVEREVMRILAGVGTDFAENREISKGQGFLGNNN